MNKIQGSHQTSCHFPVALEANPRFDVHLDEWVLSQPQLYLSFHCKAFEPIFTKEFVFDLDVKHVLHGIKSIRIQTFRWTKWDGAIKSFHVSFWVVQLYSSLGKKFVPRMMSYLTLLLSNTNTFCWLMPLFLSNLGNLKSCIVTTSCILRQPLRVLTSLVSPSNFVKMPFGRADLLIIETFKPESKSTQKSLQLLIVPIVSAVQMVTSDSCLGILIFGNGNWIEVHQYQSYSICIQKLWMHSQQRNQSCRRKICPMWRELALPPNLRYLHHNQELFYDDYH